MLSIKIPETELFFEDSKTFHTVKEQVLNLEHSLISLQKWESKWKKSFLATKDKTDEEALDYVKCMTINSNAIDPYVYEAITMAQMIEIGKYINDPYTATTFSNNGNKSPGQKEIVTAEIIYYDMIALNIPQEYRKWHLNQLLTLIQVCSIKNKPQEKMSRSQLIARNKSLNAARRQALNSKG